MTDGYLKGYREGFINALDVKNNGKVTLCGYDIGKILDIVTKHYEKRITIDVTDDCPVVIKRNGKIILEE